MSITPMQSVDSPASKLHTIRVGQRLCDVLEMRVVFSRRGYEFHTKIRTGKGSGARDMSDFWIGHLKQVPNVYYPAEDRRVTLLMAVQILWHRSKNTLKSTNSGNAHFHYPNYYPDAKLHYLRTHKDEILNYITDVIILDSFWRVR